MDPAETPNESPASTEMYSIEPAATRLSNEARPPPPCAVLDPVHRTREKVARGDTGSCESGKERDKKRKSQEMKEEAR